MTTSETETRTMSEFSDPLTAVTRRGRLVPAHREGFVELDAAGERFELLGPFDNAAEPGDDVEVVGVVAPGARAEEKAQAMLVRHVHRL
ncbi:hypothetical protein CLV30_12023 [Haloactinopolyspora alba]|uniref:Uncharacterized protein n=1 Tax=Haloactinopolyspora alba TaxID=648780 RepID=A0A2P8DM13_9ACTN|nr:hypothetical protein [Haloactinopolyspora alba]PSK98237.1 hypothetical protein CLV30_12023 [Haloactinopolyspora alba]